jgi:ElaB/YqjD/DUF883 family membrane-anchored ribosome-binding protein
MNTQDNIRTESHKDPAQLEHEIDQQRSHIEQIVSALENKLSPGEMFDRVLHLGKGGGKEFAGNLTDTIKANPVPALLTAAGLMWLYSGRNKPPGGHSMSSSGYGTTTSTTMGSSSSLDEQYGMYGSSGSSDSSMREKLGNAKHRVGESAHNAAGSVRGKAHNAADSVRNRAHSVADSTRRGATRANEGFQRMLEDNPMAVGAISVAVGALLGSLVPSTRKEDELMGQHSDRITGKAKEMARTGRESLASAGREVTASSGGASGGKGASGSDDGMKTGGSVTSTTTVSSTTTSASPSRPH